jgi:hypothetical protein
MRLVDEVAHHLFGAAVAAGAVEEVDPALEPGGDRVRRGRAGLRWPRAARRASWRAATAVRARVCSSPRRAGGARALRRAATRPASSRPGSSGLSRRAGRRRGSAGRGLPRLREVLHGDVEGDPAVDEVEAGALDVLGAHGGTRTPGGTARAQRSTTWSPVVSRVLDDVDELEEQLAVGGVQLGVELLDRGLAGAQREHQARVQARRDHGARDLADEVRRDARGGSPAHRPRAARTGPPRAPRRADLLGPGAEVGAHVPRDLREARGWPRRRRASGRSARRPRRGGRREQRVRPRGRRSRAAARARAGCAARSAGGPAARRGGAPAARPAVPRDRSSGRHHDAARRGTRRAPRGRSRAGRGCCCRS